MSGSIPASITCGGTLTAATAKLGHRSGQFLLGDAPVAIGVEGLEARLHPFVGLVLRNLAIAVLVETFEPRDGIKIGTGSLGGCSQWTGFTGS